METNANTIAEIIVVRPAFFASCGAIGAPGSEPSDCASPVSSAERTPRGRTAKRTIHQIVAYIAIANGRGKTIVMLVRAQQACRRNLSGGGTIQAFHGHQFLARRLQERGHLRTLAAHGQR